eukprot:1393362-Pyramimonas_sp.AAC.1
MAGAQNSRRGRNRNETLSLIRRESLLTAGLAPPSDSEHYKRVAFRGAVRSGRIQRNPNTHVFANDTTPLASRHGPIRRRKHGYIVTTDQSDAGSTGIL